MAHLTWRGVLLWGALCSIAAAATTGTLHLLAMSLFSGFMVTATVHAVRAMPHLSAWPWRLILGGGAVVGLGALVRGTLAIGAADPYPYPSWADGFTLGGYGLLIAGGMSVIRRRTIERRIEDVIDAWLVSTATGFGLLSLYFEPYLSDPTEPGPERVLTSAYLFTMVVLVGLLVRLAAGPGERNISYYLLAEATALLVLKDVLVRFHAGGVSWALELSQWVAPFIYVVGLAAVIHPDSVHLTDRPVHTDPTLSLRRLVLSAGAVLAGPVLLVISTIGLVEIEMGVLLMGWTILALLVLLRMAALVHSKEAAARRETELRRTASHLAAASRADEILDAVAVGACRIAGSGTRALLVRLEGEALVVERRAGAQADRVATRFAHLDDDALPARVREGIVARRTVVLEAVSPIDISSETTPAFVAIVPVATPDASRLVVVTARDVLSRERVASLETLARQVTLAFDSVTLREQSHQRRADARFRALVENSSDIVAVVDEDARMTFVSPTIRRLLGREESAVVGAPLLDLVHRPDHEQTRRLLAAPLRGRTRMETAVEVRLRHATGELRWFDMEARDLRDDAEIGGVVITASDISSRKRAETALRRSEARFRLLVQNTSDTVAIVDESSALTYVSPSVERMLGYTPADLVGRNVYELLSVTEAERVRGVPVSELDGSTVAVRIQAGDGTVRAVEVAVTDMRRRSEVGGVVLNVRDVTERQTLEDDIRHRTRHDELTGLPNRLATVQRIDELRSERRRSTIALVLMDMDDFKLINDSLGHSVGDQVLVQVAERISGVARSTDVVARLGADEFAVISATRGEEDLLALAEQLRASITEGFDLGEGPLRLTASIGVAGDGADRRRDLLRAAGMAMERAKQGGKNRVEVFAPEMEESAVRELELKNSLVRAIANDEFVLHYQPIVDLQGGAIVGAEALIRWNDPDKGMVSPAMFIPAAEETGLIREIGLWVARTAAADLDRWRRDGHDVYCSINVSGRQMSDPDFAGQFIDAVAAVDPSAIVVELTESVLAVPGTNEMFDRFHQKGFRIALDDFGTGYSALQYLQTFDIDLIKIDRSFVTALGESGDPGVVKAVLDIAASIDARTLAEGIATDRERSLLTDLGVRLGQGYLFARPMPAQELEQLLAAAASVAPA